MRSIYCHADYCLRHPEWVLVVDGGEHRLCDDHAAPYRRLRIRSSVTAAAATRPLAVVPG